MSGQLFIQSDFAIPAGTSYQLDSAYIDQIVDTPYEPDAIRHWFFGTDNPTYLDGIAQQAATYTIAPALSAGYATTNSGATLNALDSEVADAVEQTICMVFRVNTTSGQHGYMGAWGIEDSKGSWFWQDGTAYKFTTNGTVYGVVAAPAGAVNNSWLFVAMSSTASGSVKQRLVFGGGAAYESTVLKDPAIARNVGFAGTLTNLFSGRAIPIASAIIFDVAKSEAQIQAIYEREKVRLADRGITVV